MTIYEHKQDARGGAFQAQTVRDLKHVECWLVMHAVHFVQVSAVATG